LSFLKCFWLLKEFNFFSFLKYFFQEILCDSENSFNPSTTDLQVLLFLKKVVFLKRRFFSSIFPFILQIKDIWTNLKLRIKFLSILWLFSWCKKCFCLLNQMKDKNETHLYHCLQIGKLKKNLPLFLTGQIWPLNRRRVKCVFQGF